ncbi:antibiotic biosynthesis monooxygenase [Paracoccus sp. TK19116]|uniref:Antibiotic biosynthesis monooxygenase n=1 Tax=Paracoccus albicereus TaxID=2922394 RepID=A0ABT1MWP6_9RHOB|nr:putative quinol monooxygenase [Paracoccus albicereus]MCQ0971296.1 antibiotic biosynthesis monooxygenase [Paracoccus albicereus]
MHVVTVTFTLHPGARTGFLSLMLDNARQSMALEPGCRRFDVCEDPADPDRIFLYELYDDAAAFADHKTRPHYRDFTEATATMIADKRVATLTLIDPDGEPA